MKIKLYKARLKTGGKTEEQIKADFNDSFGEATKEDMERYKKSMDMVDGQEIIVMQSFYDKEYYSMASWQEKDDDVWREFIYLQEQDPIFGTYVDDREKFLKVWEAGEYEPMGALSFSKDDVEIIEELENKA